MFENQQVSKYVKERYNNVEYLSRGTFGRVYKAVDNVSNRTVAIKIQKANDEVLQRE